MPVSFDRLRVWNFGSTAQSPLGVEPKMLVNKVPQNLPYSKEQVACARRKTFVPVARNSTVALAAGEAEKSRLKSEKGDSDRRSRDGSAS
jgi:hypothetical protein